MFCMHNVAIIYQPNTIIQIQATSQGEEKNCINTTLKLTQSRRIACRWQECSPETIHATGSHSQPMDISVFQRNGTSQSHGMVGSRKANNFVNSTVTA